MKITSVIILLCITFVTAKATDATGGAQQTKTTEERVVQLEAELLALSKENNLLTDTLKNNWDTFKTTCGAVLTSKCADIAKESEKFVEMFEKKKEQYREEHDEHHEHERKLRGGRHHDDDDDDHDEKRDRHHGGKDKHHGGKHKHHGERKGRGGKHGPEPPVVKSIKCVLKQSFVDAKSVPAHCVRSAKRFDMYLKINRPSNVVIMMPPRHHVNAWAMFIPVLLVFVILGCCIGCVRRMRRSKCPVHLQRQEQPIQQAQIVLGQPVVLTSTTETSKI